MENALNDAASTAHADPLPAMRTALLHALERTVNDPQTRRVFEVATHKVEYLDSLCAVRQRHISVRDQCLAGMKQTLTRSARLRSVRLPVPAESAARGLHAIIDGLIQNWLLDTTAFDLRVCGRQAIDSYLSGLGLGSKTVAA